jgi:hypothetical protein
LGTHSPFPIIHSKTSQNMKSAYALIFAFATLSAFAVASPFGSANLCLPYADKIVNAGASTVFKALASCYNTDLTKMHNCLSAKLSVPLGCAACFGQANKCVVGNCSLCLTGADSEYCQVCTSKICSTSFEQCSGFGIPLPATGKTYDSCDNTKDISVLTAVGDYFSATQEAFKAVTKCKLDKTCLNQQFVADLHLSSGCSDCLADNTACVVENCASECILGPSEQCAVCSKKKCAQQFALCSGVGSIKVNPAEPLNQCKSAQDTAVLSKVTPSNAASVVYTCVAQCLGNDLKNCLNGCFAKTLGLTAACSECLSEDSVCTLQKCTTECANGPSKDCLNCTTAKCLPDFETCSGVSPMKTFA